MLLERGCRGEEIGVIALYKRQEQKITELLLQRSDIVTPVNRLPVQEADEDSISRESALKQVQISTVDAFQGAEKGTIPNEVIESITELMYYPRGDYPVHSQNEQTRVHR